METLQMQTVRGHKMVSSTGFNHSFTTSPVSENQAKRLKIREFISWSVCFGIVSAITGLIKFLKLGVTMVSVTSVLFYLSFSGLIYFIFRIVKMSTSTAPVQANTQSLHGLN